MTTTQTKTRLYNEEFLRQEAPAIFANAPAEHVSDRYAFIPTYRILESMQDEGFVPMLAQQVNSRKSSADHSKHMVRLRHRDAININKDFVPEIVLFNSHNWQSRLKFMGGIFRFICTNGMVVASTSFGDVSKIHRDFTSDDAQILAHDFLSNVSRMTDQVLQFGEVDLDEDQQQAFAQVVAEMRFGDKAKESDRFAKQLNASRRSEDNYNDLWTTMNRVQENAMRGGFIDPITNRTVRAVTAIDKTRILNEGIWSLADSMQTLCLN